MNRLDTIERITGLKDLDEVITIKNHHTENNVTMIVADKNDKVYDVTFAYASCNSNPGLRISVNYLQDKDVTAEDIKDAFRTNKVDMKYSFVVVSKAQSYQTSLHAWGIKLSDMIGHVSVDRSCVTDYYKIEDAELTHDDQVLEITYSSKFSEEQEKVAYVNYSPIAHDNEVDAQKAVIARTLFGKQNARYIVYNSGIAEIITKKEYEESSDLRKSHFSRYNLGARNFYISMNNLDNHITSDKVSRIVNSVLDNDEMFSQYYISKFGVAQSNLSKIRKGDRKADSVSLKTALKIIDAYNSKLR